MKKIIFLSLILMFGLNGIAQKKSIDSIAHVDIPNEYEKIDNQKALDHIAQKFNNDKIAAGLFNQKSAHIYRYKDVLLTVYVNKITVSVNHLAEVKAGFDNMNRANKTYSSVLKDINNGNVLITENNFRGISYINFSYVNKNNTKAISGSLQFKTTDEADGHAVLDHILNTSRFIE